MKLSRLAGLVALAVLAIGQARAEPVPSSGGLGFGIIRDLAPVLRPVAVAPTTARGKAPQSRLKIERIRIVRSDAERVD